MSGEPTRTARNELVWPLRFISVEAASGTVLLLATVVALAWANSPWASAYEAPWHLELGFGAGGYLPHHDLRFWVNDGLMTIFFLVVGLEIRREIHYGALSDPRVATLPIIAAAGGVLVPALLYLLVNPPTTARGWAIPTATDIAFAVGVLSLIGPVPAALRLLLLTLAIVDDMAAILVIAFFYSGGIAPAGLLIAGAGVALILLMQWLSVRPAMAYVLPGALVWFGVLRAGMHPAVAGVLLGLLTPVSEHFGRRGRAAALGGALASATAQRSPVERVESRLHPYVAFVIMPVFAFANAGVNLRGVTLTAGAPLAVSAGVVLGLVLGKPLGISLASFAAVKLGLCTLPAAIRWRDVVLLGVLGGIGFTMSIFLCNLAFEGSTLLTTAKLAVLVGSGVAATVGMVLGRLRAAGVPGCP